MGQSCSPAPCLNNKNQIQPEDAGIKTTDLSKSQSANSLTTPEEFKVAHSKSSSQ